MNSKEYFKAHYLPDVNPNAKYPQGGFEIHHRMVGIRGVRISEEFLFNVYIEHLFRDYDNRVEKTKNLERFSQIELDKPSGLEKIAQSIKTKFRHITPEEIIVIKNGIYTYAHKKLPKLKSNYRFQLNNSQSNSVDPYDTFDWLFKNS